MVKDSDRDLTSTNVDLGDDLLEATRTQTRSRAAAPKPPPLPKDPAKAKEKVTDELESARILLREGLIDDAKRTLRRILIVDPGNAPAKHLLNEILDRELKQLFGEGGPQRRRFTTPPVPDIDLSRIDPEAILKKLDKDLELGLFEKGTGPLEEAPERVKLSSSIDAQLKGASPRDRIDIGIGFLELGMNDLALKQFQLAHRQSDPDDATSLWHSASCLYAQALISCDRAHEAVEIIQLALRSPLASFEEKLDLLYQMGKACEKLRNTAVANGWYRLVAEIDPLYRDVQDRIARTAPQE